MKTWLITGCSSGFGRNLAETLLSEGEQVIVTARKPKTIQHFAKLSSDSLMPEIRRDEEGHD